MTTTHLLAPYDPIGWQIAPWRDTSMVLLLSGGSGTGKSRLAAEKVNGFLLKYPKAIGLMVRKTLKSAKNSCVPTMWEVMGGEKSGIVWNKAEDTFTYPNGSMLYTGGLQDKDQREAVRSIGSAGGVDVIWVEEATALVEQDYNELLARLRHTAASWRQIILTTNPDAPGHWINQRLIIGGEASVYESVATDNPHLPDSYYDTLKTLTGVQYQRLVLNKWVQAEGVVYDNFSVTDNVTEEAEYNPAWPVVWGVDDGYALGGGIGTESYHPRVILLGQFTPEGGLNIFAEYYKCLEVEELSIQNVLALDYPKPEIAYVDSSAAQLKARIWGMGIQTIGATHAVTEGIKNLRRMICDGNGMRLYRVHPRCRQLINELLSYAYGDSMTSINGERKPLKVSDHGCFVAGTLIETDRGGVPIEELKAGDSVLTRRGYQEIRACGVTQIANVITVTLNDFYTLTGTSDHPVWTENRGWVGLEDVGIDDIILVSDCIKETSQCPRELYQKLSLLSTTESHSAATLNPRTGLIETISGQTAFTFATAFKHCIASFGKLKMGLSQKATTFITKMATQATMTFPTLSAFSSPIICDTTAAYFPTKNGSFYEIALSKFVLSPKNGTQAKRGVSGIGSMAGIFGRIAKSAHYSVSTAARTIKHAIWEQPSSAPTVANQRHDARQVLTMKHVSAVGARKTLLSIDIRPQSAVQTRVANITQIANSAPQIVYNLTIDAVPEYFANGVLVHNCDSSRYIAWAKRYE